MPYRFSILYLPAIALALAAFGAYQAGKQEFYEYHGWAIIGAGVLAQMFSSGAICAELSRLQHLAEKSR